MFVLSSPSGAGKTTLARRLLERETERAESIGLTPPPLVMSVSVTTRAPRPGEMHGRDYFFLSPGEYLDVVAAGGLIEYARVFDYDYGTPRNFVEENLAAGIDVLFDIDWQGTQQLRHALRDDLVSVFILPPSMNELERRLRARAQDSEDVMLRRMSKARAEISHWQEYDYVLVNESLDETLTRIEHILLAERMKRHRQPWLEDFIHRL